MRNLIFISITFLALWGKVVGQIPTTIFFDHDSDSVSKKSLNTLNKIPSEGIEKIILIGHCDSTGSYKYNYDLSMRRANKTKVALIKNNFSPSQWQIVGKSFNSPASNSLKALNRRVEILPIYSKASPNQLELYNITDSNTYNISYQKSYLAVSRKTSTLIELELKKRYKIENLHFVPNKAIILEESYPSLMALFITMQSNPTLEIKIEGHTNGVRAKKTEEWHMKTSAARAKSTKDFLVSMGISPTRITTAGYGYKYMIYPNGTTKDQLKQNRRVEIKVTKL